MTPEEKYHRNFIRGVRTWMANNEIDSIRGASTQLGMTYMALYKVMDGTNRPKVEHGCNLCQKAGISGEWLFMDRGEMYYDDSLQKASVLAELKAIRRQMAKAESR